MIDGLLTEEEARQMALPCPDDTDPDEAYDMVAIEQPLDWFEVRRNGIGVWIGPEDSARRFCQDAEYRAERLAIGEGKLR